MNVLALETATSVCGAAIVENGYVVVEHFIEARQIHSQRIMGLIDEVFHAAQCEVRDIDGIAVSIGPGSFTGLRIGLSTAKGLSFALGKPIAAVHTLEAIALNVVRATHVPDGTTIFSLIDARRDEVYAAAYRVTENNLHETIPPCAVTVAALFTMMGSEQQMYLAGEGAEKIYQYITMTHPDQVQRFIVPPRNRRLCSAAAVGILGEQQLLRGSNADVASLEPLYVKEFYTTMTHNRWYNANGMV